jgi:hypothetical protein
MNSIRCAESSNVSPESFCDWLSRLRMTRVRRLENYAMPWSVEPLKIST